MKKWLLVVTAVCTVLPVVAQNSYMVKPGSGSLFGGNKDVVKTSSDVTRERHITPGRWGVGVRLGLAQNDPKDMKEDFNTLGEGDFGHAKLKKNRGVFSLEALYEWGEAEKTDKIGVKLGVDIYGQNKLWLDQSPIYADEKLTETTYAFPLTVYYKRDNGIKNWSWFAGAGVTLARSEIKAEYDGFPSEKLAKKTKVFPHLTVGAEYRFSELFALGLDVKYNINAKIKKYGAVVSDRSGIGGALTGRFYF